MAILYTGVPAPLDGHRKLSAREASQRAAAMNCLLSKGATHCQGQIHVGLFFDGTGNNDRWVEQGYDADQRARNKHSNVARLYDAHFDDPQGGMFRTYVPGVGTPFKDIGDISQWMYDNLGNGLGFRGSDRINYAILSILNAIHSYLRQAPLLSRSQTGEMARALSGDALGPFDTEGVMRWSQLTDLETKLEAVMAAEQRKVVQVNVSIFGFSRGAAQARACAFWLSQICERHGGGLRLAGVPIRIGFLGLFDTVAAVGLGDLLPFTSGHMGWGSETQSIHPAVEECAHFIALHEQRASFPLEAAVGRGNVAYPGMHSDVGGGYYPGEQGKAMSEWGDSPQLSQIPLIDMHFTAIKAGVPMRTLEQIREDVAISKSFSTDERLMRTYNNWLRTHGVQAAPVQAFTRSHASHYIRWRSSLYEGGRKGSTALPFFGRAKASEQANILGADESFRLQLRWLQERKAANSTILGYLEERRKTVMFFTGLGGFAQVWEPGKSTLSSYEEKFLALATDASPLPSGCGELFADYVHDSRAGFLISGHHEPIFLTGGYLRFRHVFEEQVHLESGAYAWANEGIQLKRAAENTVVKLYHDLWALTVSTYRITRAKIERFGRQAIQAASSAYQAAERDLLRQYQDIEMDFYRQLGARYPIAY